MKIRLLLLAVLAIASMGASRPGNGPAAFFPEDYEKTGAAGEKFSQRFYEGILVTGPGWFLDDAGKALGVIEGNDARNWYFVRKHVRRVTYTGHSGMDIGGGRFTSGGSDRDDPVDRAASIVHDAWHRELYFRGRQWEGREAEIFCLSKQNEFLKLLRREPLDVEKVLGSEYWKTGYWSRAW